MKENMNKRFYHRWWFWTAIAGVLAMVVIAALLVSAKPAETREQAALLSPGSQASAVLMTGSTDTAPMPTVPDAAVINPDRTQAEINALPVFAFTVEAWVDTMSGLTTSIGLPPLSLEGASLEPSQFTLNQSDYVFYMGRLNENGEPYTLMMGGYGDGSPEASSEILLSMTLLVASVHPEYAPSESGAVIGEMGLLGGTLPSDAELILDGTVYQFVNDPEFGVLFFASPEDIG